MGIWSHELLTSSTLLWLVLSFGSAGCSPQQQACQKVGDAATEVEGVQANGAYNDLDKNSVSIGGGAYSVTLIPHDLTKVRIANPEAGPAWLFVDQPDILYKMTDPNEEVDLAAMASPNESCPDEVPESVYLEFPGSDEDESYTANLVFNPSETSYTVWVMLIPADEGE